MHASSLGQTGLSGPALGAVGPEAAVPATLAQEPARRSLLFVGVRIGAGFGATPLLFALLSTGVDARPDTGRQERQWVQHSLEVLSKNERAAGLIRQAEATVRGFRLTGSPMFREQFETAVIDIGQVLAELRALTADSSSQQELVAALATLAGERVETLGAASGRSPLMPRHGRSPPTERESSHAARVVVRTAVARGVPAPVSQGGVSGAPATEQADDELDIQIQHSAGRR